MAVKETGEAITSTIEAMKSTPLAIALLIVNMCFLAFAWFVLQNVGENAKERNASQTALIEKLIANCKTGS